MSGKKAQRRRRAVRKEHQRCTARARALLIIKYPRWHNTGKHETLYESIERPAHMLAPAFAPLYTRQSIDSICLCKQCVKSRAFHELGIRIFG